MSTLSLLGVLLLPCIKKKNYEKTLIVLTGLGIGTLISDAVLHILPGLFHVSHSHDNEEETGMKNFVPYSCVILASMKYFTFLLFINFYQIFLKSDVHIMDS